MVTKIAYLTPFLLKSPSAFLAVARPLFHLACGIVDHSGGSFVVECLAYGTTAARETLAPGVIVRLLPATGSKEILSWELPAAIAEADLLHIHQLFTRAGEMALLLAKLQQKPLCVSHEGEKESTLGLPLEIANLADRALLTNRLTAIELLAIYREVLSARKRAAA